MSQPNILNIAIYKGSPIDAPCFRHTAFYIRFADSSTMVVQITGPVGDFDLEVNDAAEPAKDTDFIQFIPVAQLTVSKMALKAVLRHVPVRTEMDWNCQNWVGDALKQMADHGWITNGARLDAIDRMVDIILEAPDEV